MSEVENNSHLKAFFSKEYSSLKNYVNARIDESAERDAEDIIQDVALKIFSRKNNSPIGNIAGFVYGSIRNRIIDILRSRTTLAEKETLTDNHPTDLAEILFEAADNAYTDEMKQALKEAIGKLKPDYRNIIIAVDFEGYTYRELSEKYDVPVGTLMSHRHRALGILAKQLENLKQEQLNS